MPTKRPEDPEIITAFFPEDDQDHQGIFRSQFGSRWSIDDTQYDDLVNWVPCGRNLVQVPANGPTIASLPSPAIWISAQPLNAATYLFCLCNNGHIYQVSLGGSVITDVSGATAMSALSDIANWQGTRILFSDVNVSKIYSWDGATFATVFTGQPASFITVFSSRLWMANGSTVTFTAGGTFNSLAGDSGSFVITDTDCPPPIRVISPFSGNLFIGGYQWYQVVAGLFDSGSPAVLQFQKNTLTDEAGIYTKWSFLPYGYSLYYASLYGIWSLLGSQPQFVSEPIGSFFQNLTIANSSLSAAYGQVLGEPSLFWQFYDAASATYRVWGMTYNRQQWFSVSQGNIFFITYGTDQTNGQQKIWAVDTAGNLFQLFAGNGAVTSTYQSKLWSLGARIREKSILRAGVELVVASAATISLTALDENLNAQTPLLQSVNPSTAFNWTNNYVPFNWTNAGNPFNWTVKMTQYWLMDFDLEMTVKKIGVNVSVTSAGATVLAQGLEFEELPADWGM